MTKHVLIALITCALFSCTNNRRGSHVTTPKQDTFAPPKVTRLADLPDSLQPKTVLLDTMPKPKTVVVPTRSGRSYSITNAQGKMVKVNLKPPVIKPLPVLLNDKGEPVKDSAGNTFIMGTGGGLSQFTTFTTDDGLALDAISCSFKDKTGNLWFGTQSGGVSRYDGKSFTTFSTAHGLANNYVQSITEDKAGNLWFGTLGGGVSRYDGRSFTTFSTALGLSGNSVWSIAEDKTGNLWFGTDGGGVSKYNPVAKSGVSKPFTTFSTAQGLAHNQVFSIAEDKLGNLWFGTFGGGVSRYDGNRAPTLCNSGRCKHDLRVRQDLEEHNKQISKSFSTFSTAQGLANNTLRSVAEDKTGNLWFGTQGGGVSRYDGNRAPTLCNSGRCKHDLGVQDDLEEHNKQLAKSFTTFSTAQGLADIDVYSIAEDELGNLWFGTYGGGVSSYNPAEKSGGSKSFTTFSTAQGLAGNIIRSITVDNTGNLWLGTNAGGVSRYIGKSFTTFSTAQGLAYNSVFSIAEDKTGNLWFGTQGDGVSRYDPAEKSGTGSKSFTTFSTAQGLANYRVWSIAEDKTGSLWFGTDGGVTRYDGNFEALANTNKKNKQLVRKSFTTFSTAHGLAGNFVASIAEDKMGNLWFGTNAGVSRYGPAEKSGTGSKSFTTYATPQGLANNTVWSIAEDKTGSLWFGTGGGGVSRYDPAEKNGGSKSFTTFSTAQGLANNSVFCIAEDKTGNLWFGTANGLSVLSAIESKKLSSYVEATVARQGKNNNGNGKSGTCWEIFKTFTKAEGLPDNCITQILQLPDGKMAVGTNLGIAIFRPSADFTKLTDLEIYNSNTDCPVKDVNAGQGGMFLDSKGIIWAGTGSDKTPLVRFDPSAIVRSKKPPIIVIKAVKIAETFICWNDLKAGGSKKETDSNATPAHITEEVTTFGRALSEQERDSLRRGFGDLMFDSVRRFYPVPEGLELPYRHNHLTIDFNAIETGKPKMVNYQYLLVGYDKDWSPITKATSAAFGNIREGTYTFKVKAQSPDGLWCVPVTYTFKVLPPWYRTWWAYGIYALLLFLALRAFTKWWERKLIKEKQKLEKTVSVRTSEVVAEKKKSDDLLLNILPETIAEELKLTGTSAAKHFDDVTVLFTDFVGFSTASERMTPQELVNELHACFEAFDGIMGKYDIEKIKTVGDAYLAVCGLPQPATNHAENVIKAALEIRDFMVDRYAALGSKTFQIRIGVHGGSLVAGIVGVKKFAYDVWGDTVNTAARMEQNSEPGKINISHATYELVKDKFSCTYRGEIAAKNKGMLKMYFVG